MSQLSVRNLEVAYGRYQVLWGVDIDLDEGEVACLLGPNGAGKSTVMNSISGLLRPKAGEITFEGRRIDGLSPHKIVPLGIAHVLERRRLFPHMSVLENILLGAYLPAAKRVRQQTLEEVYDLFPVLRERAKQTAGTLSGGEQQMVAIARGLMSQPRLLMIDEPFLGLSPRMVGVIIDVLARINRDGMSVLFVEQSVQQALQMSHHGYVLESGRVAIQGLAAEVLDSPHIREVYLGASGPLPGAVLSTAGESVC